MDLKLGQGNHGLNDTDKEQMSGLSIRRATG
jgi:hypothetical protein